MTESLFMVLIFPGIFLYCHNVGVSLLSEIWKATVKYAILAVILCVLFVVFCRDWAKAVLITEVAMLFFMNYNSIHSYFFSKIPSLRRVVSLGIGCVLIIIFAVWTRKKVKIAKELCTFLGIAFLSLVVINLLTAAPAIIQRTTIPKEPKKESQLAKQNFSVEDKPNVYYFVLDEYAGFENIERYYNFDNAEFEQYLIDEEFSISYGSRNTEGICTYAILPNLLNLDYVVSEDMAEYDCWQYTKEPALYQLFQNNGYQINMINHLWALDTTGCNVLNENVERETLSDYLEQNGILAEVNEIVDYIQVKKYGAKSSQYSAVLKDTLDLMIHCSDYVAKNQPTFTMVYLCCPHSLFVLDENGDYTDERVWRDLSDTQPYVNQLIYTNGCIEQTVANIKENDPGALIIIQSDHGGRYPYQMFEECGTAYDTEMETPYMQNILNCVYYKGKKYEIEGLSGINTLRMVINDIFGTRYEMLENPQGYLAQTTDN